MPKHLQISIAEPCHENWDKMTPVNRGRFCDSCQKQVVDFSNMSDREIAAFFKKPTQSLTKGGSICGRFMSDQLERSIEIPKKRIPWLKYFFQFVIPAFLFSMKATSQGKVKVTEMTSPVQKPTCTPIMGTMVAPVNKKSVHEKQLLGDTIIVINPRKAEIQPEPLMGAPVIRPVNVKRVNTPVKSSILVKGKVVDENGGPIPQASILVVNSKTSLVADELGNFSLEEGLPADMIQLEVSSIGYKTELYNYPFTFGYTSAVNMTIQLKPELKVMEEVVITTVGIKRKNSYELFIVNKGETIETQPGKDSLTAKGIKPAIGGKEIGPDMTESKMLVYPNPVSTGSQLNINLKKPEEAYYLLQLLSQDNLFTKKKYGSAGNQE